MLERRYPTAVPAIHPVPEYRATGALEETYEDVKAVLQVPWMGVVTMAFAHYPHFFAALWSGVRPLCQSRPFVDAAAAVRALAERQAATLDPPPIRERLVERGYAERELADIEAVIEVFSHGNQLYVLIATIARLLMEDGELGLGGDAPVFEGRHAPKVSVPLILMEPHHADPDTRAVYEDVKASLGLPFVNTDYRALARWPSYFALAWADLKPVVREDSYESACAGIHAFLVKSVTEELPNPGGLTAAALQGAAGRDAPLEEVREVCRLFQWLLPGLITNVAFFRHALSSGR